MTRTEFLTARLYEDGATAKRAAECDKLVREGAERGLAPGDWSWLANFGQPQPGDIALIDHQVRFDPARVLREVEAKRKIITRYEFAANQVAVHAVNGNAAESDAWDKIAGALSLDVGNHAAVYSDHPDYDPEWDSDRQAAGG